MSGMRLCGSNPPGRPSSYFIVCGLDLALARADAADPAHALLAAEQLALDVSFSLPVVVVDDEPRRAVAEFRVHVFVPEIERLQDVPIGVDDVVGAGHRDTLRSGPIACGIVARPLRPDEPNVVQNAEYRVASDALALRGARVQPYSGAALE